MILKNIHRFTQDLHIRNFLILKLFLSNKANAFKLPAIIGSNIFLSCPYLGLIETKL
jgi:hypothetical protein